MNMHHITGQNNNDFSVYQHPQNITGFSREMQKILSPGGNICCL
jgi:hypothetical protein